MNYQVLARKWRPHNFTEVVGQAHVVKSLTNALQHNRLHHAYLFTGTRGVGKTTLARILAKAINCENLKDFNPCGVCNVCVALDEGRFMDLIEVDAASRTKVEDTRDLLDNAQYAPNQGRYKVYIIDEVHMLSGHSFNALLKTLEEPPPHVKFLLATTDPHKIPVTVLSRCLQFNLKRLSPAEIGAQMAFILNQETIAFDEAALKLLARAADGSLRDGLSLLDQAIVFGNGTVATDTVRDMLGTVAQQPVDDLLLALAQQDAAAMFATITDMAEMQPDYAAVLQQVLQVLHRVALSQHIPHFTDAEFDAELLAQLAGVLSPEDVQLFYQIALLGQKDLDLAPDPRTGFEMVMLRMLAFKPASVATTAPKAESGPRKSPDFAALKPTANPPPAAVPAAPPTPAKTATTATPVVATSDWLAMINAMKLTGPTREFANNCVLENIDDKVCTLIIDPNFIRGGRAEDTLQKALQAYCGTAIKLVVHAKKTTLATPAVYLNQEREDRQQAAVEAINQDPIVLALKDQFDARVMPGTIEPV